MNRFPFSASHETLPSSELLQPSVLLDRLPEETRVVIDATDDVVDSGRIGRRDLLVTTAVGSVVAVAGYTAWQIRSFFKNIAPEINIDLSAAAEKPPVMESAIAPEQYRYEVEPGNFEMIANSKVGVAVDVTGKKEGALWGLFGITDAHFDKVKFGDFLLATDDARINNSLEVKRLNGEIISVSATLDSMAVFQPRIDFSDYRNNIGIRTDDSAEEIAKKIEEYLEDGSHYDQEGGFDCTICSTSASELINAGNIIAQYAITIDAYQPDIIADATERYRVNMINQLATQYGVSLDKVKVAVVYGEGTDPNNPPTPEQIREIYRNRMKATYEETLRENGASQFDTVPELREDDDGNQEVYAKMKGGAELTVKLSGITYIPEIRDLIIRNITDAGQDQTNNQLPAPTLPEYNQPPAPNESGQEYNQPPAPSTTLPEYNQPPAPSTTLPEYNQPPAPISSDD